MANPHRWLVLVTRYGAAIPDPSRDRLSDALAELLDPAVHDDEHGDAWLRCALENGQEVVVTITRHGAARLEQWADREEDRPLAPPRTATVRDAQEALELWALLAAGDLDGVRGWRWDPSGSA